MLANLLLFLTASVAALTLLDLFMSDSQKKRLDDRVVRMWNWLDDAKRIPMLDMARTRKSQRILVAVAICAIFLPFFGYFVTDLSIVSQKISGTDPYMIIVLAILLSAAAIAIWLGRRVISMMLLGKTALQLFVRAS